MRHGICWENQKGKRACHRNGNGGWYACLLLFAGASLCMLSAYMQLFDVYPQMKSLDIPWTYKAYILTALAVLSALYGSGFLRRRWVRLLPALPLGLGFYCYYKKNQLPVEDGILYVARIYVTELCRFFKTSVLFPNGIRAQAPRALLFWSLLILCAFFVLAAFFEAYWLMLLIPCSVFAANLAVAKSPQWGSLLVLLAAGVVLTARWHALPDAWYVRTAQLAGILCICIIFETVCAGLSGRVVGMHAQVQEKQLALEDAALALPVWSLFEQHGIVDNHKPGGTGREVLTLWLSDEPTENVYLKEFAAFRYVNGRWSGDTAFFDAAVEKQGLDASVAGEQLLARVFDSQEDIFNENGSIDFLDYGGWSVAQPKAAGYRVTCRDFGTSAPLPYVSKLPETLAMEGDAAAKRPWNKRSYEGSLMLGGKSWDPLIDYLQMYYESMRWEWLADDDSFQNMASSQISAGSMELIEPERDWYGAYVWDNYRPRRNDPLLETLFYEETGGYSSISEIRDGYRDMWDWGGGKLLNSMRLSNALSVQYILQHFGAYSQTLDPLPAGADPVDYFIGTSKQGYCVHYASAATLMLQSMGIPARYASGYVAFPGDFEKEKGADGYTASITDERAHAWVEIYLEDFGWLPIEVTPGFAESAQADDVPEESGNENKTDAADREETPEEADDEPEQQEEEPEPSQPDIPGQNADGKNEQTGMSREMRQLLFALAGFLAVILVILAVIRILRARERRREEQIRGLLREGRYNAAATRMNRRIYTLLRRRAAGIGMKDDESYQRALEKLDAGQGADSGETAGCGAETYIRLVRQAYFSNSEMSEADAYLLHKLYQDYKSRLAKFKRGSNYGNQ